MYVKRVCPMIFCGERAGAGFAREGGGFGGGKQQQPGHVSLSAKSRRWRKGRRRREVFVGWSLPPPAACAVGSANKVRS